MEGGLQLLHEGSLWWREEGREGGRRMAGRRNKYMYM